MLNARQKRANGMPPPFNRITVTVTGKLTVDGSDFGTPS